MEVGSRANGSVVSGKADTLFGDEVQLQHGNERKLGEDEWNENTGEKDGR